MPRLSAVYQYLRRLLRPQDSVADAPGDLKAIPIRLRVAQMTSGASSVCRDAIGFGAETPDEIVMQMEGLAFFRRDAMDINAGKLRGEMRIDAAPWSPHGLRGPQCKQDRDRSSRRVRQAAASDAGGDDA